jgi:hypothetical protein
LHGPLLELGCEALGETLRRTRNPVKPAVARTDEAYCRRIRMSAPPASATASRASMAPESVGIEPSGGTPPPPMTVAVALGGIVVGVAVATAGTVTVGVAVATAGTVTVGVAVGVSVGPPGVIV